jgi:hypothetical protein
MSQRVSGYQRKERDLYETSTWVTAALMPHLPPKLHVWEPAAGSGRMVRALVTAGHLVEASDIMQGRDFLKATDTMGCTAIVSNPPYVLAAAFIEHALELMQPTGMVAMLLRTDFDHAASRRHLFSACSAFSKKVVLTRRIRWFEDSTGSPSFNHAWLIWDHKHCGPPTLAYGPDGQTRV